MANADGDVMGEPSSTKKKDDDILELLLVQDYAKFALRMNFRAIAPLLKEARSVSDPSERKSICLSGLQLLHSSNEDFAILLQAFKARDTGKQLHLTIGVEDRGRRGSTEAPRIFKHYGSTREMLDAFGFRSLTNEKISQHYDVFPKEKQDDYFRNVAKSIEYIGKYQGATNPTKNKLKHGKAVLEDGPNKPDPDHVFFLQWKEKSSNPVLERIWVKASLEQLETATIQVAKLLSNSLMLLGLFMINYYPKEADKFINETVISGMRECSEKVSALGLHSKGLTTT